jgi:hypothetical protein
MVLISPRIDLNPEGEQPSAVDTLMDKARDLVNGLIGWFSTPETTVETTAEQPPVQPPVEEFKEAPQEGTPQDKPDPDEPATFDQIKARYGMLTDESAQYLELLIIPMNKVDSVVSSTKGSLRSDFNDPDKQLLGLTRTAKRQGLDTFEDFEG